MRALTVIGLGHIGASVAAAARKRRLAERIVGMDVDPAHRDEARALGIVDDAVDPADARSSVADTQLVVVAVPVDATAAACVRALRNYREAIVTDCAGLKEAIVRQVAAEAGEARGRFVGGHPMAGSTGKGTATADPSLFEGRKVVLTPDASTDAAALERVERFWRKLGAEPVREEAAAHDGAIAAVSHLPHVLAFALTAAAADVLSPGGASTLPPAEAAARIRAFAGPSFEGATRVAASDPGTWSTLFAANETALRDALAAFRTRLDEIEGAIGTPSLPGILSAAHAVKVGEGGSGRDAT